MILHVLAERRECRLVEDDGPARVRRLGELLAVEPTVGLHDDRAHLHRPVCEVDVAHGQAVAATNRVNVSYGAGRFAMIAWTCAVVSG